MVSVEHCRSSVPITTFQQADHISTSLWSIPTFLSENKSSQSTHRISCLLSKIIGCLWMFLLALLLLCECHHFVSCPDRALIGSSYSVYFTLFSSWYCLSNSDHSSRLIGPPHDMAFPVCISALCFLITLLCRLSTGSQWTDAILLWSALVHCLARSDYIHVGVLIVIYLARSTIAQQPITSEVPLSDSGAKPITKPLHHRLRIRDKRGEAKIAPFLFITISALFSVLSQ